MCYLLKNEVDYARYVKMLNSSPIFTSMAKSLEYEKIGLQILRNQEVIEEFTSHNKNGNIAKVEKGLKDPEFTIKIEEDVIEELMSEEEQDWIKEHPIEAMMKYSNKIKLPFTVKLKLLSLLGEV